MNTVFDFVVIGAGSGGLPAVEFATKLGLKVALVEKSRVGGDCTWTGCVPSKALLKAAKVAHLNRTADQFGVSSTPPTVDMKAVRDYVQQAIAAVYQYETPERLTEAGITVYEGSAQFIDSRTIQVGDRTITAKKFLITTGASPNIPNILGLDEVDYFTYEKLFENDRLPNRLIVLGAGPVGVEMAQAYRRLGAQVTLIDRAILPEQDREAARAMLKVFVNEGIRYVQGLARSVNQDNKKIIVEVDSSVIEGDMLLVATGRKPNVSGLDLEKAGIEYSADGIKANSSMQTTARNIYAAGDVTGGMQFTHLAAWQGFQAARNALLPGTEKKDKPVPFTIFTDPEVAHVGLTEEQAREKHGRSLRVAHLNLQHSDRAVCENNLDGFLKIMHLPGGKILGATIVADRAGESITEFVLAIEHGLKLDDLAETIHVYPSYAVDAMRLAADATMDKWVNGVSGSVVRRLAKISAN
jgi:pyruvate/2-oxoglutarate dehydrogenase complex dihydrolipoamide dehydrogenase (E3) component